MRGERTPSRRGNGNRLGSSPHARGTLPDDIKEVARRRFIPACAGNALPTRSPRARSTVHPRMRGEREWRGGLGQLDAGSSPHARGTQDVVGGVLHGVRFIPACAGNAAARTCPGGQGPVHPRMRGERSSSLFCSIPSRGSSPHARGTHDSEQLPRGPGRFIPACAGNARTEPRNECRGAVHPRMRGERGVGVYVMINLGRFIPACAGNAPSHSSGCSLVAVHPRMRGERY